MGVFFSRTLKAGALIFVRWKDYENVADWYLVFFSVCYVLTELYPFLKTYMKDCPYNHGNTFLASMLIFRILLRADM